MSRPITDDVNFAVISRARLLVPTAALDHVQKVKKVMQETIESIRTVADAAYLVQAGLNEDMTRAEQGHLQEIDFCINFDIQQDDRSRILD